MILNLYSIYDLKAGVYNTIFTQFNDAVAQRSFTHLIKDKDSTISSSPADYVLYCVGTFDDTRGYIDNSADYPRLVIDGKSYLSES